MADEKKRTLWQDILRIVITILTAIATTIGTQAATGRLPLWP